MPPFRLPANSEPNTDKCGNGKRRSIDDNLPGERRSVAAMSDSRPSRGANGEINKLYPIDRAVHEWYRFVLSFPPHLVRHYLERFGIQSDHRVLDPFCGTGTTIVECKKLGIPAVGVEANPMAHFASQVKTDWSPDPDGLLEHACQVANAASSELESEGIEDDPLPLFRGIGQNSHARLRTLPRESQTLLLIDSISPLPLHKTLVLLDCLNQHRDERYYRHELLALAKALVCSISNLHFGPEVGIGPAKPDAPVIAPWLAVVHAMADDIRGMHGISDVPVEVYRADSRVIFAQHRRRTTFLVMFSMSCLTTGLWKPHRPARPTACWSWP